MNKLGASMLAGAAGAVYYTLVYGLTALNMSHFITFGIMWSIGWGIGATLVERSGDILTAINEWAKR